MPIYSFYRIVKDIIRTIFGGKFWRKFLIIILISIAIWFILHDKGYCLENTVDINYKVYEIYNSTLNDAIMRIGNTTSGDYQELLQKIKDGGFDFYFYYGNSDGSSYNGGQPMNKQLLYLFCFSKGSTITKTATTDDFMNIESITQYFFNVTSSNVAKYQLSGNYVTKVNPSLNPTGCYLPLQLYARYNDNWTRFVDYLQHDNTTAIIDLLNEIKSQNDTILETMTQDVQDTSQGVVDTSIVDTSGTAQATQNVQSLLTIIQGFYNNIGDEVYTITFPIKNTSFSIRSDIISSHISGTWLATFLNTFWYFIFGMYYLIFLFRIGKWLADGSLFEERRRS